jgi:hypothetical protein
MTDQAVEEYRALRATIAQRGTVRTGAFVFGLAAWALAAMATAVTAIPLMTLVPLVLLAATFEAVFSLHVGVERIGRYLQVFHEDRWEDTAMRFGRPLAGTTADPLFTALFALATVCNFVAVALAGPVPVEVAVLTGAHALFGLRLGAARRAAARQRVSDLERFQQLKRGDPSGLSAARGR